MRKESTISFRLQIIKNFLGLDGILYSCKKPSSKFEYKLQFLTLNLIVGQTPERPKGLVAIISVWVRWEFVFKSGRNKTGSTDI